MQHFSVSLYCLCIFKFLLAVNRQDFFIAMDDSHRSYNMSICRSQGQGGGGNVGGVKIGGLWKRSQGMSRFTKPNYKHRVFILTEQALSYYCGTVDVSENYLCIFVVRVNISICRNHWRINPKKTEICKVFRILTELLLFLQRIGQLKGRVPLETIRAVEFVEESAFCLAHTMQVSHVENWCRS